MSRWLAWLLVSLLLLLVLPSPITPSERLVDGWKTSVTYSDVCVHAVKNFEVFRAAAYKDPVGIWTIGYGTTFNVKPGQTITEANATERLCDELEHFAKGVTQAVRIPLTQNQFDALVSLAYNIGLTQFRQSTLLQRLNRRDYKGAADAFTNQKEKLAYVYGTVTKKIDGKTVRLKVVLPGLVKRRAVEKALFLQKE